MSYSDYDLLPKLFVLNGTVKTTGTSADLTAGDFGLYDKDTHAVITTSNEENHPNAYIAQGSYYASDRLGTVHGGFKESIKSPAFTKGINPKNVKRWYKVGPKDAVNKVVRLFWDETPTGTSPAFLCGKTYYTRLEVKGEPVLRFINRYLYKQFGVYTGCCANDCTAPCTDEPVDSAIVLSELAKQINEDPLFSRFVSAQATYQVASTTATFTSADTTLTVASGTNVAIGQKVVGAGVNATVTAVAGTEITISSATTAAGTSVAVSFSAPVTDAYVSPSDDAAKAAVKAGVTVGVIYSETVFGDASFNQSDYYNQGFVDILASSVHENGDPCKSGEVTMNSSTGDNFKVVTDFKVAQGSGETILRDFIASQLQSGIFFSHDNRSREVSGNVAMTAVDRHAKYNRYYLIYSVDQSGNPSNALSHDQYILSFALKAGVDATSFEALMLAWLQAHNPTAKLETVA